MTPLTPAQADLVAENREVATHAAIQARQRWPRTDPGDLLSYANFGLVDAARTWDAAKGMTFVGYARQIVRHRIVDEWRREHGRRPGVEVTPFDPTADDLSPSIIAAAASVEPGFEAVEATVTVNGLELTERERYVLVELGSGTSMREIGDALGVSESRVSQIRKAIYDRLPNG